MIHKSYRVELNPTNKQITMFKKHVGCSRFVYNWALNLLKEDYDSGQKKLKSNAWDLQNIFNSKKKTEFPWVKECSKWVPQTALKNLQDAYKAFYKNVSSFPKYKKKSQKESFVLLEKIRISNCIIKLPKIGKIKLKENNYIPIGISKYVTISTKSGRWFASVVYEELQPQINSSLIEDSIGIDLGIKNFATCSDGTIFDTNQKYKSKEKKLKRLQRKFSRQTKGSNSKEKTKLKLQKIHFNISNSRKDLIHKTTSYLTKTKLEKTIVIEDLNVSGMLKNHRLAKSVFNIGIYEFRRQLEYKCLWYGKQLIVADRWFASSKICSDCGNKKEELKLSERIYNCGNCRLKIDRDLNASINLKKYKNTVGFTEINADGDERFIESKDSRCLSKKSEKNNKLFINESINIDCI